MATTATLNPTISPVGTAVLVEGTPYDFEDGDTRRKGTSYKLHMITDLGQGPTLLTLKVGGAIGPRLLEHLKPGMQIEATATGFARPRGRSAVIEYTVRKVIDAKSGDVIVDQV